MSAATPATKPRTRQVPASAFHFAGEVQFGQFAAPVEGEKTPEGKPVHIVLRSGQPVEHPYWGKCVHDFAGMQSHKDTYPLDYCHDPDEVIGHFSNLDTSQGQLEADGQVVPFKDGDRASEILHRQASGTPYEASVFFDPRTAKVQYLDEDEVDQVNGQQVEGPCTIFRQWDLRGGALCPQGADKLAHAEFSQSDLLYSIDCEGTMSVEHPANPAAAARAAAAPAPAPAASNAAGALAASAVVSSDAPPDRASEGKRFLEAFGDKGGLWFAQGLSFEDSQAKFTAELRTENETLRKQLSGKQLAAGGDAQFGEAKPLSFEPAEQPGAPAAKVTALQQRFGKNLGSFMAAINIPKAASAKQAADKRGAN